MFSIKKYLSLVKFSHTIFAMPFALIGFFLGILRPPFYTNLNNAIGWGNDITNFVAWKNNILKFSLVILCMIFARSAAMAFNRWLDAKYDALNPRTAIREIPAGIIKPGSALLFTIINCALFIACTFFINKLCFYLSPVALFVILFYSYTKRFTALCHLVLGVGLSLAPIGAYLAVTGSFALLPILFSLTVLFWVSGFDIIYALQDEDFDKQHQLHSIPAAVGKTKALRISELLHLLAASCVVYAGVYGKFGTWYWSGVAVFAGMLLYQAWGPALVERRLTGRWVLIAGCAGLVLTLVVRTAYMVWASDWDAVYNVPGQVQGLTYFAVMAVLLVNSMGFVLMQMEFALEQQHALAREQRQDALHAEDDGGPDREVAVEGALRGALRAASLEAHGEGGARELVVREQRPVRRGGLRGVDTATRRGDRDGDERSAPVAQRVLDREEQPLHCSFPSSSASTRSQRAVRRLSCVAITNAAPSAWQRSRIRSSTCSAVCAGPWAARSKLHPRTTGRAPPWPNSAC